MSFMVEIPQFLRFPLSVFNWTLKSGSVCWRYLVTYLLKTLCHCPRWSHALGLNYTVPCKMCISPNVSKSGLNSSTWHAECLFIPSSGPLTTWIMVSLKVRLTRPSFQASRWAESQISAIKNVRRVETLLWRVLKGNHLGLLSECFFLTEKAQTESTH